MQADHSPSGANAVIILAAGRGARMGETLKGPKQYEMLGSKSVLQTTIECFEAVDAIHHILVVIHGDDHALYEANVNQGGKLLPPCVGGETRQISAHNGLKAIEGLRIDRVLIHDAARPFVSQEIVLNCLSRIAAGQCVLPAIAVSDTLKRASETAGALEVSETVSRDGLFFAQTPQGFDYGEILAAHAKASEVLDMEFTDDAAIGEWSGMTTRLVEGSGDNIKITTLSDLDKAINISKIEVNSKVMDVRTGNGYDLHRLVPGEGVILGGVTIPSRFKLDGHSDADVALHALTDALLGTIGAGDIGSHFPPSDDKWKGANSDQFLAHACQLVRDQGGVITHCDLSIICEEPKIGPHRDAMRTEIARICEIELGRISVKATTNERIGAIGRGEGIAAIATTTVVFP